MSQSNQPVLVLVRYRTTPTGLPIKSIPHILYFVKHTAPKTPAGARCGKPLEPESGPESGISIQNRISGISPYFTRVRPEIALACLWRG